MIPEQEVRAAAERMGVDVDALGVNINELRRGAEVELEHTPVVDEAVRIALEHLQQVPDYYTRLQRAVGSWTLPFHSRATVPLDVNKAAKAQWVRVADVVVIGPLMYAGGVSLSRNHPVWGAILKLFGLGTIAYNAYNWWQVQQELGRTQAQ